MGITAAGARHRERARASADVVTTLLTALDPPGLVAATLVAGVLLLAAVRPSPVPTRAAGFLTWATTSFGIAYIGLLLPAIVLVAHLAPAGAVAVRRRSGRSGSAPALAGR